MHSSNVQVLPVSISLHRWSHMVMWVRVRRIREFCGRCRSDDGHLWKRDHKDCQRLVFAVFRCEKDRCSGYCKNIEAYAFRSCSALTEVILPEGLENIYNGAFSYSKSLTSMKLPSTLKFLDVGAFGDCTGLTTINIPPK